MEFQRHPIESVEREPTEPVDMPVAQPGGRNRVYKRWVPQTAREALGVESDEQVASGYSWIVARPGLSYHHLARSGIEPFQRVHDPARNQAVTLWRQRDIDQLHDRVKELYRGGWYRDPKSGHSVAARSWFTKLVSQNLEYTDRILGQIGASPHLERSRGIAQKDQTRLFSLYAYSAALEHERQKVPPGVEAIGPDPETGELRAIAIVWGRFLGMKQPQALQKHLDNVRPEADGGSNSTTLEYAGRTWTLYPLSMVKRAYPQGFDQPALRAQVPGVLVHPKTGDRYITLPPDYARLHRKRLTPLVALNTKNQPAQFFLESALPESLHKQRTSDDPQQELALINEFADLEPHLLQIQAEVDLKQSAPQVELSERYTVMIDGLEYTPGAYFLSDPNQLADPTSAITLHEVFGRSCRWVRACKPDEWTVPVLMKVYPLERWPQRPLPLQRERKLGRIIQSRLAQARQSLGDHAADLKLDDPALRAALRNDASFLEARNRLVMDTEWLIWHLTRSQLHFTRSHADLYQECFQQLIQAAERFDPDRGVRFATYAGDYVRRGISLTVHEEVETIRLTPRAITIVNAVHAIENELALEFNRQSTDQELAVRYAQRRLPTSDGIKTWRQALELARRHVAEVRRISTLQPTSLDQPIDDGPKAELLQETIPDPDSDVPAQTIEVLLRNGLPSDVRGLVGERNADILIRRYGLDGQAGQTQTLAEIANAYGLSKQRISDLGRQAQARLRTDPEFRHKYQSFINEPQVAPVSDPTVTPLEEGVEVDVATNGQVNSAEPEHMEKRASAILR